MMVKNSASLLWYGPPLKWDVLEMTQEAEAVQKYCTPWLVFEGSPTCGRHLLAASPTLLAQSERFNLDCDILSFHLANCVCEVEKLTLSLVKVADNENSLKWWQELVL